MQRSRAGGEAGSARQGTSAQIFLPPAILAKDVFYFVLRLAQRYNIDLTTELNKKMEKNDKKYPVEKVKGLNKKYTEY